MLFIEHNEYSFKSAEGLALFAQSWVPKNSIRGNILLIHGLGEHSGRYSHVGVRFANAGYALSAFDLRGHGKSDGKRGHSPSLNAFLDDIDQFIEINQSRIYDLPLFLYGHSLGGVLVINYSILRDAKLSGLLVTAPSLRNEVETQIIKLAAVNLLSGIFPSLTFPSGLNVKYLSVDESIVEAYLNDPLVHDRASLSLAKHSLKAISRIFGQADKLSSPILVMHGSMDKISFPSGTTDFVNKLSGSVTFKLWEGFYHELHNEPDKEKVFAYMIDWLNTQI
jgi:alpha-beta hydrolase superfamily lysophospholipase